MAVTKKSVVSVLVVLAITYNQGAARSLLCKTKTGLSSSEESLCDTKSFKIPTAIKKGLGINIKGNIDPQAENQALIVELSKDGIQSCQFKFNFTSKKITVQPSPKPEEDYDFNVAASKEVPPSFSLVITARHKTDDMFVMTFLTNETGQSMPLICKIDSFNEINQIDIKEGVAYVNSLQFNFE